jgi:uncharacterized membrane protein
MTPLYILIAATLLLRAVGLAGVKAVATWRDATRFGLAVMFVFTGSTHFSSMKYDYAAMIPPPLTGQLWVIYLTGIFEIAGGIGLFVPQTKRAAAICLLLLLLALFPANVYAAINAVQFRGAPPTDVWLRGLVQAILVAAVWWSTVGSRRMPRQPLEQTA